MVSVQAQPSSLCVACSPLAAHSLHFPAVATLAVLECLHALPSQELGTAAPFSLECSIPTPLSSPIQLLNIPQALTQVCPPPGSLPRLPPGSDWSPVAWSIMEFSFRTLFTVRHLLHTVLGMGLQEAYSLSGRDR